MNTQLKNVVLKGETPEQQLVYSEVYAPDRPDTDGEYMDAETILKMAHDFAKNLRFDQIDVEHDGKAREGCCVVESFIARKGDPDFIEGSWVVGVHVGDDELWQKVKKGEINGFSVEALVAKDEEEVEIEIPPVVTGSTSKSEDHEHQFFVSYDENGEFLGGVTDEVNGHRHRIVKGTVTETSNEHSHRFSSVDNLEMVTKTSNTETDLSHVATQPKFKATTVKDKAK
jgi:hypothetical protein